MKRLSILAAILTAAPVFSGTLPFETEGDRRNNDKLPSSVLIKTAKVITITNGDIVNGEIWIENGKIRQVGKSLKVPSNVPVYDAHNLVVMPGLVDAHVHRGIDSTNEGSDAITDEVRIRDVIDPDSRDIWYGLASGETTGLFLHGSANPIGGESLVAKFKYGHPIADMPIADAPRMCKFALGENVTRASSTGSTRFPNSRMGVEAVYRRAFTEARRYLDDWAAYDKKKQTDSSAIPPRKDLRLQTLADMLTGKVWVQCHSYRADEILMLARLSKEFGFKIGAFQHALEAYKIAPELAAQGIPVSTFSDEWSYKLEAYDANTANAGICTKAGVLTSINTDGTGGITPVIIDAGKSIREGSLTEEQAFKLITINPAKQLGVDKHVGSIEAGKDADLSFWDGHPFSTSSKCMLTVIEGEILFQRRDHFDVGSSPNASPNLAMPKNMKLLSVPKLSNRYALTGADIYPMSGPMIKGGTVLIVDGKIAEVGRDVSIPSGTITLRLNGLRVYPGAIDSGTALGLSEISPIPVSVDTNESGDFQADLVAGTAVQRDSAHFGLDLCHGVLSAITRPGGTLICGQATLLRTWGWTSQDMDIDRLAGLVVSIPGFTPRRRFESEEGDVDNCMGPSITDLWDGIVDGVQPQPQNQDFEGRMKTLSDYFDKAEAYAKNKSAGTSQSYDLQLEAMVPYVTGQKPVYMRTRGVAAIQNGIKFAQNHHLKAILVGANDAWRIADEVKASGYPVLVNVGGQTTLGATSVPGPYDPYDTTFCIPALLKRAGIKFAIQSEDNALSFLLPIRTGMYTAYGLTQEEAYRAISKDAAEIIGVGDQLGTIQTGKRATLSITNGDPLDTTTVVVGAFIDGRPMTLESRQTKMRDMYLARLNKGESTFKN